MTQPAHVSTQRLTLADYFEVDPRRFNRVAVIQQSGLQVLHLSLAPGQAVPRHNHPGHHVILQGLAGRLAIQVGDEELTLEPGQVLHFSGRLHVSPRNAGTVPAATLITLVRQAD